jgi:pimeloyl-ACP methyl ester carboxylesterase
VHAYSQWLGCERGLDEVWLFPKLSSTLLSDRRESMGRQGFRFRGETLVLDAQARASAPGQFVNLPAGTVHYEMAGPPDAQTVVLVHGFSVPYYIWDPTFSALANAGFRVLRYDLFGRGFSDRPDVTYDQDLFDRQLLDLLSALGIGGLVDVVGLSMGGAIVVEFTDRHPQLVRRLCLVDPAGLPMKKSLSQRIIELPGVGEWLMSLFGDRLLVSGIKSDVHAGRVGEEYVTRYREQMRYFGFKRALLSTIRSGIISGAGEAYEQVGRQERPMMLIWGREDQTVPFTNSKRVRELLPQVEFHPIDGAGHIPHYELPDVVNPLLIDFLSRRV